MLEEPGQPPGGLEVHEPVLELRQQPLLLSRAEDEPLPAPQQEGRREGSRGAVRQGEERHPSQLFPHRLALVEGRLPLRQGLKG